MAKKLKHITSLKGKFLCPPKSILLKGDKTLRRGKVSGQRPPLPEASVAVIYAYGAYTY